MRSCGLAAPTQLPNTGRLAMIASGEKAAAKISVLEQVAHIALITLLTAVSYSNILANDYQLDAVFRVDHNNELEHVFPISRFFTNPYASSSLDTIVTFRPLLPLCLAINRALSEICGVGRLAGYHIGDIVMQAI